MCSGREREGGNEQEYSKGQEKFGWVLKEERTGMENGLERCAVTETFKTVVNAIPAELVWHKGRKNGMA